MIKAYKRKGHGPNYSSWKPRNNNTIVFYKIEPQKEIKTPDGSMMLVKLRHKVNLANPDFDVAALLGNIKLDKNGRQDSLAPELWFWEDKYWIKAVGSDNLDYYRNKNFALYEVSVEDSDNLMGNISTIYD